MTCCWVGDINETEFEVLVDFSPVAAVLKHLEHCVSKNKALVIGTTGFDQEQIQAIRNAANIIPIILSPNMSVGVNLCFHLLKQAAEVFGDEADIEIQETHHRNKLDAPSGTAVRMGEVIADVLGRDLAECAVYGRQGIGQPRDPQTIGFVTTRAGDSGWRSHSVVCHCWRTT